MKINQPVYESDINNGVVGLENKSQDDAVQGKVNYIVPVPKLYHSRISKKMIP